MTGLKLAVPLIHMACQMEYCSTPFLEGKMANQATATFIAALVSSIAAMADSQHEAQQTRQQTKPQGQQQQHSELPTVQRKLLEELAPQRQLDELIQHERQLQKQQQPVRIGK